MSVVSWKSVFDFLLALGSILGYVVLVLEGIVHYADLKRWFMKPNFRLEMYSGGFVSNIMVTNRKTGNPLKDWRISEATDCMGYLAIKKHETSGDSQYDIKETTPLCWEGEGKIYRRICVSPLPAYLQAFRYDFRADQVKVRYYEGPHNLSLESSLHVMDKVDVFVQIQSNEGSIGKWLKNIDLRESIRTARFPEFTDDC
jgi:hypothetical protein